MIKNYKLFFEGLFSKKEECKYFYSNRLRDIFTNISNKNKISVFNSVLHAEGSSRALDDITLFDIGDDENTITFIQVNRLKKMKDDNGDSEISTSEWTRRKWLSTSSSLNFRGWTDQRTSITLGRFLTRIFRTIDVNCSDKDKETWINTYKSEYKLRQNPEDRFELVCGDDIKKWYSESAYQYDKGQLSNSCMRYDQCQSYFDIYTKNPEVCQLLILHDDNQEKIIGRAFFR